MSVRTEKLGEVTREETVLRRLWVQVWNYIGLTRPRVLNLVLLTAPPAVVLGRSGSWPGLWPLVGVLAGCGLIGAGCGAINAWWERERDARMDRTRGRPLPTERLTPRQAIIFGVLITMLGLVSLYLVGGWLPLLLGSATVAHYVLVYTVWLKPRTPHNIVIGGVAGAAAPVIADAAINGSVGFWSIVLFGIVFFWQPPHVWAITLYRKHEYEAAGFPMMPSVVGNQATRWRMLGYALILFPVTILPWMGGVLGTFYGLTAVFSGLFFLGQIVKSLYMQDLLQDRRVFTVSLVYLSLLFSVMVFELILR